MTKVDIAVELKEREVVRKGLNGLRKEGVIPGVIHNHGKESILVQGDYVNLMKVYATAGKHHPVQLHIGGKQQLAMIKDADFEPVKHQLRHLVFQAVKQNEKVEADIPVVLAGEEIPAERVSLLVLQQLDTVQVAAFPRDLPDKLEVDATGLAEVGDKVYVSDIKAPDGVEILTEPDMIIAVVEMPKDQAAAADESAASLAEDAGAPEASSEEPTEATAEAGATTDKKE